MKKDHKRLVDVWIALGILVRYAMDLDVEIHLWYKQVPPENYRMERIAELLEKLRLSFGEIQAGVREMIADPAQKPEKAPF